MTQIAYVYNSLPAAPSAAVLGLSGVNSSSTSLTISWQPPPPDDQNGVIRRYDISYGISTEDASTYSTTSAMGTMIELTGLAKFTVYNVTVRAFTIAAGPPASVEVSTDSDRELCLCTCAYIHTYVHTYMYVCLMILLFTSNDT